MKLFTCEGDRNKKGNPKTESTDIRDSYSEPKTGHFPSQEPSLYIIPWVPESGRSISSLTGGVTSLGFCCFICKVGIVILSTPRLVLMIKLDHSCMGRSLVSGIVKMHRYDQCGSYTKTWWEKLLTIFGVLLTQLGDIWMYPITTCIHHNSVTHFNELISNSPSFKRHCQNNCNLSGHNWNLYVSTCMWNASMICV